MVDVASIASTATTMSQTQVEADVQTSVARRALDIQESTAAQLLDALPDVQQGAPSTDAGGSPVNPADRVGEFVDTSA